MAIALDGFKVLRRLGEAPETFAAVRADADKAARALVVKCLKAKATDLDTARAIRKALHDKPFDLLVDGLKASEIKSLLTKFDRHHPELKTMSTQEQRARLLALTSGAAVPAHAVTKNRKTKARQEAQERPQRLQSDVMDLYRARGKEREDD